MTIFEELADSCIPTSSHYKYLIDISDNEKAYLYSKGVLIIKYKQIQGVPTVTKIMSYKWRFFKILSYYILNDDSEEENITYYTFKLQSTKQVILYQEKRFKEMLTIIQENCLVISRHKAILTPLINEYLIYENIPQYNMTNVYGYLPEKGWCLPNTHRYMMGGNSLRAKIAQDLTKNMFREKHVLNPFFTFSDPNHLAKFCFKTIYELTSIQHKDYLFAWSIVAPFLYALRKVLDLMPPLAMGGSDGDFGKSAFGSLISVKYWGHVESVIGSAIMDKRPRVEAYFSSVTFPMCVDDCQDLKAFIIGLFKRYFTNEDIVTKMNSDATTKMRAPFCVPPILTYNEDPELFKDPRLVQRLFGLIIDKQLTKENNQDWKDFVNWVPNGLIGRYIYEKTKDISYPELVSLLQEQDSLGLKEKRGQAIAKLINLGAYLCKKIFDIELNLSDLAFLIGKRIKIGNEEVIELMKIQIAEGANFEANEFTGAMENPKRSSWVRARIFEIRYKDEEGYLLRQDNLTDLRNILKRKSLKQSELKVILQSEFGKENIIQTTFSKKNISDSSFRAIFIKKFVINDVLGKNELAVNMLNKPIDYPFGEM